MKDIHIIGILIVILLLVAVPSWVRAQSYSQTVEQLGQLNRINPLQNPGFERSDNVLNRKILDRKNKVVGQVRDILLNKNGTIQSIATEFDRLANTQTLFLNYRDMRIEPADDGYILNLEDNQIEDLYAEFLANMDTAAGGEDVFSAQKIIGLPITEKSGKRLGVIKQILFGVNGARADAVYVELTQGLSRGDTIAIPFRSVDFKAQNNGLKATIDKDLIESIKEIAE
ncbi:MAG: PRC-barrel domain-containing protein [Bdellovibrionales bacterium]